MSGGGSTPTAPSLAGNTAAANNTFGTATTNAAQTMNTATATNANAQKNLSNVVDTSNSMAGKIGANADTNLNQYGAIFSPLQAQQAKAASDYGSDANVARMSGRAVADVGAASEAARRNSAAALASEGVDPASIHGGALDRQAEVAAAAAKAGAGTNAAINTQLTSQQLMDRANQIGLQVGQQGTSGAATGAGVANAGQSTLNQTNASDINNLTAANSYLNTGINANKSAADISSQDFHNQMDVYNAQQAQSAGVGALVGDVAGVAMMAMMEEGGPVTGTGAIPTSYSHGGNVTARGALPTSPIPGSTDTKPALLTPGEFVIPKDVVDFKGQDYFHRQIDSIREARNKRMAIPVQHAPHVSIHS